MPHQCVRCNTLYQDGSSEILKGCSCGSKLFFFVRDPEKLKQDVPQLSPEETRRIEEDVKQIIGVKEIETPVVLDIENINIEQHGKFMIDVVKLFKGDPIVYKTGEGKYTIDLGATFQNFKRKTKKKGKK